MPTLSHLLLTGVKRESLPEIEKIQRLVWISKDPRNCLMKIFADVTIREHYKLSSQHDDDVRTHPSWTSAGQCQCPV